jgi:hypothetical protein
MERYALRISCAVFVLSWPIAALGVLFLSPRSVSIQYLIRRDFALAVGIGFLFAAVLAVVCQSMLEALIKERRFSKHRMPAASHHPEPLDPLPDRRAEQPVFRRRASDSPLHSKGWDRPN